MQIDIVVNHGKCTAQGYIYSIHEGKVYVKYRTTGVGYLTLADTGGYWVQRKECWRQHRGPFRMQSIHPPW